MSVQQFCLRWNNHQPNFISVFSTLLHNETLVDVTLAAEGRQLQAHKVVLSACSSYFQTLFTTNPCQHPIVILKDVQYIHLKTMVDFMYYGEVNVSQEQLPHILKTAEMLKIKGLAEMPDATSLTKSESKSSSSDHIEQITGGTVGNESIWGSTESQQFHHQQQRRTPSPASLSPATRRKRLRKSSTGSGTLSTERTSEEQSSIDGGSNLNIGQMDQMTTFVPSSGNISSNINNSRILKETSSTETDHPHQESSQESVEESMHHTSSAVMKSDDDMGNVSHTMPLDIAGSTSNTGQQQQQQQQPAVSCPQPQPDMRQRENDTPTYTPLPVEFKKIGVQWTLIDSNYPRFYQPGLGMQTPTGQNNTDAHQNNNKNPMGSKRGRFLIRQPRIKKDSDLLEHHHSSPDVDEAHHSHGSFHHHLLSGGYSSVLTIPTKIERHSSEPGPQISSLSPLITTPGTIGASPFMSGTSPHLLSVPQPSYLVKQHSHPLLPSQSHSPPTTTLSLQRQLSHPITQSASLLSPSVSLHTQLSTDSIITSGLHSSLSHFGGITAIKTEDMMGSGSSGISSKTASPTVVVVTDPLSNITSETTIPSIRIKTEELQRSISSPLTLTRELSVESARSSHCPVVRPGPALGCNFCWNTIDAHGRILRRKTKYHCPECQTNLCIVPCFQEFHERQTNENSNVTSGSGGGGGGSSGNINNSGNSSSNTGSLNTIGTNNDSKTTLRHYPKTGSL